MSKTQEHNTSESDESTDVRLVSRRKMLRGMAAAGGAGAIASGKLPFANNLKPVGKSEAIPPVAVLAGFAAGSAVTGAIGFTAYEVLGAGSGNGADVADSAIKDEIHTACAAVASQRGDMRDFIRENWISPAADATPTANALFAETEAIAVDAIANGNGSTAKAKALDELDKRITISIYNAIQSWNEVWYGSSEVPGLITALIADIDNSTGQITPDGESGAPARAHDGSIHPVVEESQVASGDWALLQGEVTDLPADPANIDEIPVDKIYYPHPDFSGTKLGIAISPNNFSVNNNNSVTTRDKITCLHPSRSTVTPLNVKLFRDYLMAIDATYGQMLTDVETYVTELVNQLDEGFIDPSQVLSLRNANQSFADSDKNSQLGAALAFSGASIPDGEQTGYEAKVSHPDLADDTWGTLYVNFAVDPAPPISPGTTIPATDYEMAYLAYEDSSGEPKQETLASSSGDLQILDVNDVSGEETTGDAGGDAATDSNGKVVIWDESQDGTPPDPIRYPSSHTNWTIRVEGSVNTHNASPTDLTESDGVYSLSTTGLSQGEQVESVRLIPPVDYQTPTTYASDPSTVDPERVRERLKSTRETQQAIRDLDSGSIAGGGSLGDGLPTLPGLGVVESAIVVAAGFLGINALSS